MVVIMVSRCPMNAQAEQLLQQSIDRAEDYFRITNEIIGVFAFTSAIACISTDNPRFYALLVALFSLIVWSHSFWRYRNRLKMLRNVGWPGMRFWPVTKKSLVAFVGWLFMGAVIFGYFDKYGLDPHLQVKPLLYRLHDQG